MKQVKLYEFGDLTPEIQEGIVARLEKEYVAEDLSYLNYLLTEGEITKEMYEEKCGMDDPIFPDTPRIAVMAMYYNKHKEEVDTKVKIATEGRLYNRHGIEMYGVEE